MTHEITMNQIQAMPTNIFSIKDDSVRGCHAISKDKLSIGDKVVIDNYFTTIIADETPEAEQEQSAEMHENILTVGLFDKDTEKQEISTEAAKRIISEILIDKYDIFAFTMFDCLGVYKMQSTGRIVREPSIKIEIASDEYINEKIFKIIDELKAALNQETIMHKHQTATINFK